MSRILITGGSGYLGRHLARQAIRANDVFSTYYQHPPDRTARDHRLDLRDEQEVRRLVSSFRPQVVVHTAGSERGPDFDDIIRLGAKHITRAVAELGARLIHMSTDVIFDGWNAPYDENARPSPVHAYGRSKAAAEATVGEYENHVIIRTSLIYGLDEVDHGTAQMIRALRSGEPFTLFTDQRRNPVWVETLCRASLELAESGYRGVLHVAGGQVLTRAEFGLRMLDWWQIDDRETLRLGPRDSDQIPHNCELDLTRARSILETPLLGVDEVLARAVENRDKRPEGPFP